jgi:hypothetical protein
MTETEFNRISGEEDVEPQRRYESISRVRRRIKEELPQEVEMLSEHNEELLEELREVVCEECS